MAHTTESRARSTMTTPKSFQIPWSLYILSELIFSFSGIILLKEHLATPLFQNPLILMWTFHLHPYFSLSILIFSFLFFIFQTDPRSWFTYATFRQLETLTVLDLAKDTKIYPQSPYCIISCSLEDLETPFMVNRLNHFWPLSNNCWTILKKYYGLSLTIGSDVLPMPIRERQILDLWKTDIKNSFRLELSNCQYFCFVFGDMLVKKN